MSSVRDVVTIRTNFGQGVGSSPNPPIVSPVQFDIQAPPAAGTGATVNLRLMPQGVTGTGNPAATVMAGGNGYPTSATDVPVQINGGDYDASVPFATPAVITANTNALGQVTSLNVAAGFGYRTRPTLIIGGSGSGAIVRLNWTSTIATSSYTNGPSTVTAGGSGYLETNTPTILVTGLNSDGEVASLTIGTSVASGAVVGVVPSPGTISSITSAVVVSPIRANAFANSYSLLGFGELTSVTLSADGSGYAETPAPTVTVRGLRGGSGAMVTAEVKDNKVNTLNIMSHGSGYSPLSNANYPTASQVFSPPSATIILTAGQEKVLDAYYGTGRRSRDIQ